MKEGNYSLNQEHFAKHELSGYFKKVEDYPRISSCNGRETEHIIKENGVQDKVQKERKKSVPPISFLQLFRFSTCIDKCLILIGCVSAIISSAVIPWAIVLLGQLLHALIKYQRYIEYRDGTSVITDPTNTTQWREEYYIKDFQNYTVDIFLAETKIIAIDNAIVGLVLTAFNYLMIICLGISGSNQIYTIKSKFMKSVLKQDITWFETQKTGDFAVHLSLDLLNVREGLGEHFSRGIYYTSTAALSLSVAFYYGWKLTLVILSAVPLIFISIGAITKIQDKLTGTEMDAYGKAGAVAEEVLSSIRTVAAFGGEQKEIERYEKNLIYAKNNGLKRGLATSIGLGFMWFFIFAAYSLAFWYGVRLVVQSRKNQTFEYVPDTIFMVFFNILDSALYLGQVPTFFDMLSKAKGSAARIYDIIARIPAIDSSSTLGMKPKYFHGVIELRNIHFNYPARPDVSVLNGLSLEINPGETVALVGSSGCGKSTIVQLIQRFYDPHKGQVTIDGINIKELNIGWLRNNIGVVGQEPVLFADTILENIRLGKTDATQEEIERAAKDAHAHNFIMNLPMKYNTLIGERGAQLSGGQKQRIAIARALVCNPRILLLDEATSALDTESEALVQTALDQVSKGRTTIIVAHRLSTIKNADKIVVISNGLVKEIGSHTDLIERKGLYYELVISQLGDPEENVTSGEIALEESSFNNELHRLGSISSNATNISTHRNSETRKFSLKQNDSTEENLSQSRLLKLMAPEWPFIAFSCFCAIIVGTAISVYGIFFGNTADALSLTDDEQMAAQTAFYCTAYILTGVITGLSAFFQYWMLTIAGERLTLRLRKLSFSAMLRQDMSWYDDPKNRTGILCQRLSSDAAVVQSATGARLCTFCLSMAMLLAVIIIGMIYNWKLSLIVLSFVPVIVLTVYVEIVIINQSLLNERNAGEEASKIAVEAVGNIRTVASLHQEERFFKNYVSSLVAPLKASKFISHIQGLTFGLSQGILCFVYSVGTYYGSHQVAKGEMWLSSLLTITESTAVAILVFGFSVAYAPDYQKAKIAAINIFKLLDLKPAIDSFSSEGDKSSIGGCITFDGVHFNYPIHPEVSILRGLRFNVEDGQTVALVGSSGCGKSTCIQLLERFYDAQRGKVLINDKNVRDYNIRWLRSQIGVVSQEPVLFSYSVAENIAYGDNSREVTMEEIIAASRQANIHNFINSLPEGYGTNVGSKGSQLSGGQKQRIAIARALIHNPKIILLDEATSALDAESEKVVQQALDKATQGRTCIIIAHRLSTIQNAEKIVVIHNGRAVEEGTHQELLYRGDHYYRLCNAQI